MKAVFLCPLCNKLFRSLGTFKQHIRRHWKSYILQKICPICNKPIESIYTHTEEKKDPLHMLLYFASFKGAGYRKRKYYREICRSVLLSFKINGKVTEPIERCSHVYRLIATYNISEQFVVFKYMCNICGSTITYTDHV